MKRKTLAAILAGIALSAGAVAGCGTGADLPAPRATPQSDGGEGGGLSTYQSTTEDRINDGRSEFTELQVELSDGRTVMCLRYNRASGVGISCDWEHAE